MIASQITLAGMGLIFIFLTFLWGMMVILVRVTKEKKPGPGSEEVLASEMAIKKQAAAAAVAAALAQEQQNRAHKEGGLREFPLPPTALVSAWQAVRRANLLNKRGNFK